MRALLAGERAVYSVQQGRASSRVPRRGGVLDDDDDDRDVVVLEVLGRPWRLSPPGLDAAR